MNVTMQQALSTALLSAAAMSALAAPPSPQLAWLRDGEVSAVQRSATHTEAVPATLHTPLGSVWKLFVYGYLNGRQVQEPVYRCVATQRQPDDDYCCDPGDSIGRDEALARSCGPYFEPQRLALSAQDWQRFWREQDAPAWLLSLDAMQPGTQVAVPELLQALRHMPAPARIAARQALLPVVVRDDAVLASLGSGPRFKTWSWQIDGERAGGAAGWLADGTPFWFGAAGTSRNALHQQAAWIGTQWRTRGLVDVRGDAAVVSAQPCVEVAFFQRYPIRSVHRADGGEALPGPLNGRHRLVFVNGTQLVIDAVPAMALSRGEQGPIINARLPLEDYVARVVDREGRASETEAARALAVAARSYVLQNASETEACRQIADDSRTQRVSPNPPSAAARAAAAFTEGVVVSGQPVRYHLNESAPGVLSWQAAVDASRRGMGFETILREAYPGATLGAARAGADCEPLPQAEQWLAQRQRRWREVLRAQPGFQPPGDAVRVCQLAMGTPHSDQRRLVIRVREWTSREGRVTLIHEFLHLAFRDHPNGQNEAFIEQLAQRLADS